MSDSSVYLEFQKINHQVKATAIDPNTGIEVSIIAPANASRSEVTRVAVGKLKRRLALEADKAKRQDSVDDKQSSDVENGILV